jgi:arabinose-5-phosphate isomerase
VTGLNGALQGIITDGDLRRHMDGLLSLTAAQVMTSNPRSVAPDVLAEVALAIMNDRKITCVFVKQAPEPGLPALGILHIHDLLRAGVV